MKSIQRALRHLFVPGHHNNHHSALTSHRALTAYLILAISSFVLIHHIGQYSDNVLGFATDISPDRIIEVTNAKRQSAGLGTLTYDARLAQAAAAKAQDMMSKGYWAHFGPNGESPWDFILGVNYQYEYAGENLAKNFMDSGAVVEAWMNSETHRANLLNGNYKDIGVAMLNGNLLGEETTLVVQMFGTKSAIAGETTQEVQAPQPTQESLSPVPVRARTLPTDVPTGTPVPYTAQSPGTEVEIALPSGEAYTRPSPSINLYPAFRMLSAVSIVFLVIIFTIDLFHISRTQFHRHRGKHLAHMIFLVAILIGMYFLSKGTIL